MRAVDGRIVDRGRNKTPHEPDVHDAGLGGQEWVSYSTSDRSTQPLRQVLLRG